MSNSVSASDVRGMFARYVKACERAGVDVSTYRLREGDSANAWRVERTVNALGGVSGTIGTGSYGFLGNTRKEAYKALWFMACAIEDVKAI